VTTEQKFMTADETDRYVDGRIKQAMHPKRGVIGQLGVLVTNIAIIVLIVLGIAVFLFVLRINYGLPVPLPANIVGTAAVTFSTAAAPLPTARQVQQQPASMPAPPSSGADPWPTLTPEPPTPTQEAAPPVALPNLVPSNPDDNPGFNCGVEPGMDPNATCDPGGEIQSSSIPKKGPRHVGERGSEKIGPEEGGE
jgi:hypothetical protein